MKRNISIYLICTAVAISIASCAFMRGRGFKATYMDGERSIVLSTDSVEAHGKW